MLSRRQFLTASTSALAASVALRSRATTADDLAATQTAVGDSTVADRTLIQSTEARADLYRHYAARLGELAEWCDERRLAAQAAAVRDWLPARQSDRAYLFIPRDFRGANDAATTLPADALLTEFATRWASLRRNQSAALCSLAERAAAERQASLACQLMTEAAREDFSCRRAWRFLGFSLVGDHWQTPFEIEQARSGRTWQADFGWLPKTYIARYEAGERFYRGRWMPAAEEARLRQLAHDDWRIETDHFVVTTNCSLADGVALAGQLERLRTVWLQVFTGYLIDEDDLSKRLTAGEPLLADAAAKHNVVQFRTRQQYNDQLRSLQPQIEMTLGIYLASRRTAYFFAGAEQEAGTIDHEATHQLFHESRPVAKDVGQHDNFWIVEAVACHMQSLVGHDGYYTLGGADAGRMPVARKRRLQDGVYLPLAQLVGLGMRDLQNHPDIARLYTQSAGLAAFLLERYPEATAAYLRAVYSGRADSDTLRRLTGTDYPDLDRQYGDFLAALDR